MLWTIAIIFALLWVLGIVTSFTLGGFIHVLLVATVALLLVATYQAGLRARRRRVTRTDSSVPREAIHASK